MHSGTSEVIEIPAPERVTSAHITFTVSAVKFAVLGPLTAATDDGLPLLIRGRHPRTLLAVLLLHAGEQVSVDRLVDALWDGTPPKSYLSNLHTYLSRLRDTVPGLRLDHVDGRYRLRVDPADLDLHEFRAQVRAGRQAKRTGDAAAHFRRALALWRDRPLVDLECRALEPQIAQLDATRLDIVEECVEAELALGRHCNVVGELQALVAEHPLRERLCGQLMVALCGTGRQADALAVFREARANLVDTLGVEPGPDLQRLHQDILRGDAPVVVSRDVFPICQLPPDIADFTGRNTEIGELSDALLSTTRSVPVVVLTGEPGVGKTSLAVRVAHAVRGEFPDGQLFVHLDGVRDTGAVLAGLLRSTGCPGPEVPDALEERAGALRARLADRRVLVVLDDASGLAQVRALLPGTPGAAVLVTSRNRLSGLPGALSFRLSPLSGEEARLLLERVTCPSRIANESSAAERVMEMCGNLPLALRIAGTRLATRPNLSLRFLADRLTDEHRRLDELAVGELQVRTSLTLSYDGLTPLARKAFRRLGLLWPCSFPGWVVAALLATDDADAVVEELVETCLLAGVGQDVTGEPRYRQHDLLRLFGRERAEAEDDIEDRTAAERTLMAAALGLADLAARQLPRALLIARLVDPVGLPGVVPLSAHELTRDPSTWFTAEQANLVAIALLACERGWHREAFLLVERLNALLWCRSSWSDMVVLQEALRAAAERADDDHVVAKADHVLALINYSRGRHDEADAGYRRCAEVFERHGDRHGSACTALGRAQLAALQGDPDSALRHAERARELFRVEGDDHGAAATARLTAIVHGRLGHAKRSLASSREALALTASLDDSRDTALALAEVALSHLWLGDLDSARTARAEAIALLRHPNPLPGLGVVDVEGHQDEPAESSFTRRVLLGLAGGGWQGGA